MPKIDRPINFKASSSLEDIIAKAVLKIDRDKSSVLRACVQLALPQILAHPELVDSLGDGEAAVSNIVVLL
jgi:hypothetical protein